MKFGSALTSVLFAGTFPVVGGFVGTVVGEELGADVGADVGELDGELLGPGPPPPGLGTDGVDPPPPPQAATPSERAKTATNNFMFFLMTLLPRNRVFRQFSTINLTCGNPPDGKLPMTIQMAL